MAEALTKEVAEYQGKVTSIQIKAAQFVVASDKDVETAEEMLHDIKEVERVITLRKQEITKPLMAGLASARDLFKPLEEGPKEAKKIIKEKLLDYQAGVEAKLQLEREAIGKRVEKGTMRIDTAVDKMGKLDQKKKPSMRKIVKIRITDEALVPREWCTPDIPRITEAILKQDKTIPGVERYEERIIVTK